MLPARAIVLPSMKGLEMPATAPEEERLFDEAADLIIRLQNDPENPVTIEMVQQWRCRSPAHELAWAEIAEIHGMAGKILRDQRNLHTRRKLGLTRRNLMIGAGVGGGAYVASKLVIPDFLIAARADHLTRTAEVRPVSLDDGTIATLGPDSALALAYSVTERRAVLLSGMCYFEVPEDRRPFCVEVGPSVAVSTGAAFDLSYDAGFLTVSARRGRVELRSAGEASQHSETIDAGQWLTRQAERTAIKRGTRDLSQIASWRNGLIVAEHETVSAVVARIARWQPGRTLVLDSALGERSVSGVYDIRQPIAALEAVVHPFRGKIRRISTFVTIVSSV